MLRRQQSVDTQRWAEQCLSFGSSSTLSQRSAGTGSQETPAKSPLPSGSSPAPAPQMPPADSSSSPAHTPLSWGAGCRPIWWWWDTSPAQPSAPASAPRHSRPPSCGRGHCRRGCRSCSRTRCRICSWCTGSLTTSRPRLCSWGICGSAAAPSQCLPSSPRICPCATSLRICRSAGFDRSDIFFISAQTHPRSLSFCSSCIYCSSAGTGMSRTRLVFWQCPHLFCHRWAVIYPRLGGSLPADSGLWRSCWPGRRCRRGSSVGRSGVRTCWPGRVRSVRIRRLGTWSGWLLPSGSSST